MSNSRDPSSERACVHVAGAAAPLAACLSMVMALGTALPGCGGGSEKSTPRTSLSASDFASSDGAVVEPPGVIAPGQTPASTSPYTMTRSGPIAERGGVFDVVSSPGEPVMAASATQTERPVLIDAKVGDVNGRPVFITDFFQSMDARLRATAKTAPTDEVFARTAWEDIQRKLNDIVNDELLQAEARANLTPEEKQGFRSWVQSLQSDFLSRNYRSRTIAEQRLSEAQEAASLEDWTKKREQRELILYQLRSQVLKNVHVPFREIELYYDRKYNDFNPTAKRTFRVISIDKKDPQTAEGIRKELEAGGNFEEIAGRPVNMFRAKDHGLYVPPPPPEPKAGSTEPPPPVKYFEIPALNEAALALTPDAWAGPIETGSTLAFLKLEETKKASTSLYDAQSSIEQTLRSSKSETLMKKYIGDLMKRASVDDLDKMARRLLDAAMERYWLPQRGK